MVDGADPPSLVAVTLPRTLCCPTAHELFGVFGRPGQLPRKRAPSTVMLPDAPEYIWMPKRTGVHGKEAQFFRDMLKKGVPAEKVESFEKDIAALAGPASAQQKAALVAKYKGMAAAYPAAALDAKLAPLGMKAADFK